MIAALQHRPGELIQDRYEVVSVLGSGAFGTVYECRDVELGTAVAVKELHVLNDPATASDEREAALAQFRQEAIHLSHLRHPHIVWGHYQPHHGTWLICPVCGHTFRGAAACPQHGAAPVVLRQRHYLVMEFLDGPNLAEAAEASGGTLDIGVAARYVRQIAEALRLIHERGWVHRDIKPENIRVRLAGDEAVLLDFGIATASGAAGDFSTRQMRHTTGGGTFGYAPDAPEERRYPDARSDIHALGMTLYRLVSGYDPLEPNDLATLRAYHPRALNAGIPAALEALILRAIDSDPLRRPQNAGEFLAALEAVIRPAPAPSVAPASVAAPVAVGPPLTFRSGEQATDLAGMIRLMDRYPREARDYLYNGDLATWLAQIGRVDLAQRAREIRREFPQHKYHGLEALAQSTGLVEPPRIEVQPRFLEFGTLAPDDRKTLLLHLRNTGRGHLFGELRSSHFHLEFHSDFDGNQMAIPITLNAGRLERGRHRGEIVIDSSAGEERIPFAATVRGASGTASAALTVVLWSVLGMLSGQFLRTLPTLWPHVHAWDWLDAHHPLPWFPAAPLFGLALWIVLTLLVIGESLRQKSCAWFLGGGTLAALAALCGAALGTDLLVAGDMTLRPLMSDLTHHWAAGGWMFAGGVLGACYGTLRRWKDVFSGRLPSLIIGWIVAMLILYAVLLAALAAVPAWE